MSNNELAAKLALLVAILAGIVALGSVIILAIGPIFLFACIVDLIFRQTYNSKFDDLKGSNELDEAPDILNFDARVHEGRVLIAWHVVLPRDSHLDIYRVTGAGGGSVGEILERGICVHSTGREITQSLDEAFYDDVEPGAVVFYVPIVSGLQVKKEPLTYSFLSFARDVQFITRKHHVRIRGEAVRVEGQSEEALALPDTRDEASKLKDEVLEVIKSRKKQDAELDAAIQKIMEDDDLSDFEKAEAIELMETRIGLA